MGVNLGAPVSATGKGSINGDCYYLLGWLLWASRCKFNGGGRGPGAPGRLRSSWAGGAGRAGVSTHLLMAGIWGVIERGGRPGARVGLHEQ
jgi:hypothetical protein